MTKITDEKTLSVKFNTKSDLSEVEFNVKASAKNEEKISSKDLEGVRIFMNFN